MNDGNTAVAESRSHAPATAPDLAEFSLVRDAFLLDVDGTILDIAPTPEEVRVPSLLKTTLARLQKLTGGALALVSGRPLAILDRMFSPLSLPAIGCHGAEWRKSPQASIERRAQPLSDDVKSAFFSVVSDLSEIRIEDKGYTLAFHYRRVPERKSILEARLAGQLARYRSELCLLHGKSVFEVKPHAFDKGEGIAALMRLPPFANRRPVFLGDDRTDEYAFTVVRKMGGVGISVGRKMANAERILPAPHAVRTWLGRLASTLS